MSGKIKMASKGKCGNESSCGEGENGCSKSPSNGGFFDGDSDKASEPTSDVVYTIGGVKVIFPVKAYPSQMAMMAQIVKGCHRRQNCLLESPTGSGKSLALLCSTLGWQQAEKEKANRYNDLVSQGITDPDILARAAGFANGAELEESFIINDGGNIRDRTELNETIANKTVVRSNDNTFAALNALRNSDSSTIVDDGNAGGFIPADEDDDDDDFAAPNPRLRKVNVLPDASQATLEELRSMDVTLNNLNGDAPNMMDEPRRMKIPKIFFGTRTHKQVAQIVKELKRSKYRYAKTAVLGSREHTCIHPVVSKSKNKNEGCRQLLDPKEGTGCRYKNNVPRVKTHELIQPYGIDGAWDIEDMVKLGKKRNFCPYFTARELMASAEIIFCPYNYLVDPGIRDAMMINLKGQVVILDEAHNIEDSAREAASAKVEQEGLIEAKSDLEKLSQADFNKQECDELAKLLSSLSGWIVDNSENLNDYTEFDRSGKIFSGTEMIAILDNLGYPESKLEEIKGCFKTLVEDNNDDEDENSLSISSPTRELLNSLLMVFHYLFKDNMKYRDDYKIALVKAQERKKAKNDGNWFSKARRATVNWTFSINFWCLNPAVSFHEVGEMVRCIILTSGTLSPMASFQSELGVPFSIKLEANHVIEKKQVFISSLSTGPTNQTLQATYRFTETWGFQDELGRLVLSICMAVPHGVLCFLPSYSLLDKLVDRWRSTGLWDEISKYKFPLCEPRRGDEFEDAISTFYDTIRGTKETGEDEINGAFFMAVCRGKVSEGMDFTDDNARAVIAVGIPFPNFKDIQVDLKKKYNDLHCRSRGLLTGSAWYEIQAYRALNQALGRCIRHKYDWGALLLVDERYQRGTMQGNGQNKYIMGLSKWVRGNVRQTANCINVLSNLKQFAIEMKTNPPKKPEVVSLKEGSSKHSENNLNKEVMNGKASDIMFKKPYSAVKSEKPDSIQSKDLTNFSQVEGLSNTIVADIDSIKQEDEDFFLSPTSLVIPSGRPAFTSTQISGPSFTSTQIDSSFDNASEKAKGPTFITATQRESAMNPSSSNAQCRKIEGDDYEFQFLDTQKDNKNVSPLKLLIENEIKEKNIGSTNSLHEAKKQLKLSYEVVADLNESKSSSCINTSSPDMFDEDLFDESPDKKDDRSESTKCKAEKSPLKALSWNSNRPPPDLKGKEIGLWYANKNKNRSKNNTYTKKRKSYGDDIPSINISDSQQQNIKNFFATFGGGEAVGTWQESKSNKKNDPPLSKKLKHETEPETSQTKKEILSDSITEYDSDLDDFNLDKSYSTPLVRKVVNGTRRLSNVKRKGVVFEEFDD